MDNRVLIKLLRQEKRYSANSPDLNPVDYQILGKLQKRVHRSRNHDVDQLKLPLIEEWEHFHIEVEIALGARKVRGNDTDEVDCTG